MGEPSSAESGLPSSVHELQARGDAGTAGLSAGYRRTIARRGAQSTLEQRVIQAVKSLVADGGYEAVSRQTIRRRARLRYKRVNSRFETGDEAFLLAYDDVSRDLHDELTDCAEGADTMPVRIASCIHALADFAQTGGPAADLWFLAVREGSVAARERRIVVLAELARVVFHGSGEPGANAHASATRDLVLLGGILEVLAIHVRTRSYGSLRDVEAHLTVLALAANQFADL